MMLIQGAEGGWLSQNFIGGVLTVKYCIKVRIGCASIQILVVVLFPRVWTQGIESVEHV
jgi:hypothetical protein